VKLFISRQKYTSAFRGSSEEGGGTAVVEYEKEENSDCP
jgi:hypothetical protein